MFSFKCLLAIGFMYLAMHISKLRAEEIPEYDPEYDPDKEDPVTEDPVTEDPRKQNGKECTALAKNVCFN
ncbi:hypothetical protein DdX_13727 [Ditylenchus destructor]|uniref:Uncharacterized protein n=1 Tax=Ditylenchus destructor TaxID=166010 RepID=A0AAD4MYC9_9BILA|nr:hypothetical protein DdX_13727 [Ditylenchus destructor]